MALWDDLIRGNSQQDRDLLIRKEEIYAREANGFVRQTDWWAINDRRYTDGFEEIPPYIDEFLVSSTPDVRHVAVLLSQEAHLDPYDLEPIFRAAHFDGSSYLAHYIYGISMILELYYATSADPKNGSFISNNQAKWRLSTFGLEDLVYAARLVGTTNKTFSFDCGRLQPLYAALERDLDSHCIKPDWFVPATKFLPFEGVEPDCDVTFWDAEVLREPSGYSRPMMADVSLPPQTEKQRRRPPVEPSKVKASSMKLKFLDRFRRK